MMTLSLTVTSPTWSPSGDSSQRSSPLIALSSVDRLDLMQLLFDTVIIPVLVCDEVMGTAAKIAVELPSFIRVEPIAAELPVRFLKLEFEGHHTEFVIPKFPVQLVSRFLI